MLGVCSCAELSVIDVVLVHAGLRRLGCSMA
jgi:hypothetical protein